MVFSGYSHPIDGAIITSLAQTIANHYTNLVLWPHFSDNYSPSVPILYTLSCILQFPIVALPHFIPALASSSRSSFPHFLLSSLPSTLLLLLSPLSFVVLPLHPRSCGIQTPEFFVMNWIFSETIALECADCCLLESFSCPTPPLPLAHCPPTSCYFPPASKSPVSLDFLLIVELPCCLLMWSACLFVSPMWPLCSSCLPCWW